MYDHLAFQFKSSASHWYSQLTESECEAVNAAISPLADLPESQWPTQGAKRLSLKDTVYVVPVDDSIRAYVRPRPGKRPEVVDFARQEMLDLYFKDSRLTPAHAHEEV